MGAVEIIAVMFSLLILFKLAGFLIVGPRRWMRMSAAVYKREIVVKIILVLLLVMVGYFVVQEISIIKVMAVLLLASLLLGIGLLPYGSALISTGKKLCTTRKDLLQHFWLPLLLWAGLALWTLYVVQKG